MELAESVVMIITQPAAVPALAIVRGLIAIASPVNMAQPMGYHVLVVGRKKIKDQVLQICLVGIINHAIDNTDRFFCNTFL